MGLRSPSAPSGGSEPDDSFGQHGRTGIHPVTATALPSPSRRGVIIGTRGIAGLVRQYENAGQHGMRTRFPHQRDDAVACPPGIRG